MMSTEILATKMGAGRFAEPLERAAIEFGIVAGVDKVRWLAQLGHESAGFKSVEENLRYSAGGLRSTFGSRNGLTDAKAVSLAVLGQQAIANFVYGGEWGQRNLGNVLPGHGWTYRGRGLIHTTGLANYTKTSRAIFGDMRLVDNPDLLLNPEIAARAAAWFWMDKGLNGVTSVEVITRRINGGLNGLADRQRRTDQGMRVLSSLAST